MVLHRWKLTVMLLLSDVNPKRMPEAYQIDLYRRRFGIPSVFA